MATQESAVLMQDGAASPHCDPSSHANYRWLSPDELKERLHNTQRLQQSTAKRLVWLRAKIAQSVKEYGVELDATSHNDVKAIMEQGADKALSAHPPGSFAHVFWQQQLQAASTAMNEGGIR